jgi:hypothetical protein
MIEQSIVHLPELVKDIDRPVSIYLVHLSRQRQRGAAVYTSCRFILRPRTPGGGPCGRSRNAPSILLAKLQGRDVAL